MSAGDFTQSLQARQNAGQARFFNPRTGQFAQPDTIIPGPTNPQAFNRYAYVLNNPVNFVDPTGHDPWWCGEDLDCIASKTKKTSLVSDSVLQGYTVKLNYYYLDGDQRITYSSLLGTKTKSGIVTADHATCPGYTSPFQCSIGPGNVADKEGVRISMSNNFEIDRAFGREVQFNSQSPNSMVGRDMGIITGDTLPLANHAPTASQNVIDGLTTGNLVQVVYQDSEGIIHVVNMPIGSTNHNDPDGHFADSILLIDQASVINQGDSGGGVYFGGEYIGAISGIINGAGAQQVVVTLFRP